MRQKKLFLAVLMTIIMAAAAAYAENPVTATTEDGRKVLLYSDGTWRLLNPSTPQGPNKKAPGATKAFQTAVDPFVFMYDPILWSLSERSEGKQILHHKNGALYGMIIAENLPLSTDEIKRIAIRNAKDAAPDIRVIMDEKRIVNGIEVSTMKMRGTIEGVEFMYYGNYYGNDQGVIQVLCYTSVKAFNKYEDECLKFINGFTIKR